MIIIREWQKWWMDDSWMMTMMMMMAILFCSLTQSFSSSIHPLTLTFRQFFLPNGLKLKFRFVFFCTLNIIDFWPKTKWCMTPKRGHIAHNPHLLYVFFQKKRKQNRWLTFSKKNYINNTEIFLWKFSIPWNFFSFSLSLSLSLSFTQFIAKYYLILHLFLSISYFYNDNYHQDGDDNDDYNH